MSPSKSLIYLATVVSLGLSIYLWFNGQKDAGVFIGLWVPTILILGTYSEVTKRK